MKFTDRDPAKLRLAKRIAAVVGVVVGLIFCVTGYLGYVYFTTDRPARETLAPWTVPEGEGTPDGPVRKGSGSVSPR